MPYDPKILAQHQEQMTRGEGIPVTLVTHYEKRAEGQVRLERLSEDVAGANARKWLILCLVVAPFTFAFPPHFPWPLVMITAGFIGFYMRKNQRGKILCGEGKCPQCGAFQIIDGGNAEYPLAHFCSECSERSLIQPSA